MKCPHCGKDLTVPVAAEYNAFAYRKPVTTITSCCGMGIYIKPKIVLDIEPIGPDNRPLDGLDDWGRPIPA